MSQKTVAFCWLGLHLHPFKIQITQQLQPGDPVKRKMFYERVLNLLESDSNFAENVMFTDEAHFDLFGNANRQSMRYYSETNPLQTIEKPLYSSWVTV